jgi:hypothetical protein
MNGLAPFSLRTVNNPGASSALEQTTPCSRGRRARAGLTEAGYNQAEASFGI